MQLKLSRVSSCARMGLVVAAALTTHASDARAAAPEAVSIHVAAGAVTSDPASVAAGTYRINATAPLLVKVDGLDPACKVTMTFYTERGEAGDDYTYDAGKFAQGVPVDLSSLATAARLGMVATCGGKEQTLVRTSTGECDVAAAQEHAARDKGPLAVCPSREAKASGRTRSGETDAVGSAGAIVNDVFQVLADVAVERAKRKGFELVRQQIEDVVCDIKVADAVVFDQTCALIHVATIDDLASEAKALRSAVATDLVVFISKQMQQALHAPSTLAAVVQMITPLLRTALGSATKEQLPDPKAMVDLVVSAGVSLAPEAQAIWANAVASARLCVAHDTCNERTLSLVGNPATPLSLPVSQLIVRAALVDQGADTRARWRAFIELVDWIAQNDGTITAPTRQRLHAFLQALLDEDVATIISTASSVVLCTGTKDDDACRKQRRSMRALTTIAAFAATYQATAADASAGQGATKGSSASANTGATAQETRKALINELMDLATDRSSRETDTIFSLGINVGFVGGVEWLRDPSGGLAKGAAMAPQISLPTGVSLDIGLGRYTGIHFMVYPLDLGQYAAYSSSKGVNGPRWDTAFVAGGQAAFMFGQRTPVMVGVDARYAPTLFAQSGDSDLEQKPGGSFRVGLFLSYYLPLLDLN